MGKINGFESALEALRGLDKKSQDRILSDILKQDPEMAEKLKQHLVQFEDLLKINPQGLMKLFSEIPDAKWVLALRGKDTTFIDQLMKAISTRKADLIKAAIAQLGPQSLTRIESTQREIIAKAMELEAKGLLIFSRDGDPLV
jgi:flagellar motor switch protein FliG